MSLYGEVLAIVQLLSCVRLSLTVSQSFPKFMSTESVMPSNHLILCCLLLPSVFPRIRVSSNDSALCSKWSKCWRFSFIISPSNEYSGLITFRIDWFDLLEATCKRSILVNAEENIRKIFLKCSEICFFFFLHYCILGFSIAFYQ